VPVVYKKATMTERLRSESFIVRIYRRDAEGHAKIEGFVEVLDGSMRKVPFRDADELVQILGRATGRGRKETSGQ
jgi:hypothetical protein